MSADTDATTEVAPAVPGDAAGIASYADAVLVELAALDARPTADATAAAGLVERLRVLHRAMGAVLPARARPRVGWLGRLLGRDIVQAHEADALAGRIGVLLLDADRAADALRADVAVQRTRIARVEALCGRLAAAVAALQAAGAHGDVHTVDQRERRAHHLGMVDATHRLSARQQELIADQNDALLARYRNIRDVLLPVWRQRATGAAAAAGAERADAAAAIEADVAREVDAMTATLAGRVPDQENAA